MILTLPRAGADRAGNCLSWSLTGHSLEQQPCQSDKNPLEQSRALQPLPASSHSSQNSRNPLGKRGQGIANSFWVGLGVMGGFGDHRRVWGSGDLLSCCPRIPTGQKVIAGVSPRGGQEVSQGNHDQTAPLATAPLVTATLVTATLVTATLPCPTQMEKEKNQAHPVPAHFGGRFGGDLTAFPP